MESQKQDIPKSLKVFNQSIKWVALTTLAVFAVFPKIRNTYGIVTTGILGLLILISVIIHIVILLIRRVSKK